MNGLGIALATAALQVTLAAGTAALLIVAIGRRSPRTAAVLAALALGLCGVLTVAAVAPSPRWWSWDELTQTASASAETRSAPSQPSDDAPDGSQAWTIRQWLKLLPAVEPVGAPPRPEWSVWSLLAGLFLVGLVLEFLRLLAGLRAVAVCRRRSRPILDADLAHLADELRSALGGRRPVELRALAEVGTAATVGWWRPVILLADDWPTWPTDERRAVLAHELAHIRRRDYLTGLLAAACRALHFYHPLVRWLAGRLRLHQELIADALAATAAGGRPLYLRALARMALRQDEHFVAGVARPFLTDRGTLMRRVAMLRVTDDARPVGRMVRWGLAGLLVLAALGASAVRGPAQGPASAALATELPPFDLTYMPASANSVYAFRPAAILTRPDMKEVADRLDRKFAEELRTSDDPIGVSISLHEIEQVVMAGVGMRSTPPPGREWQPGEPKNSWILYTALIRTTHDFDWPALVRAGATALKTEVREVRPKLYHIESKQLPIFLFVPDRRTVCMLGLEAPLSDDRCIELLEKLTAATPAHAALGPAWSRVERSAMAIAIDNRTGYWTESFENSPEAKVVELLGQPAHMVAGLDVADTVVGHIYLTGADETAAEQTLQGIKALAALGQVTLKATAADAAADQFLLKVYGELLKDYSVRRDGTTVTAEFRSPTRLVDLSKLLDFGEPVKK